MGERIRYDRCVVCDSDDIGKELTARDHTVSGESFEIWQCYNCSLRFTQNVPDSNEIGRYYASENYVSHSDSRRGLINTLYHLVRHRTMAKKYALIRWYTRKENGRILDIGAGTGVFLHNMKKHGWETVGVEPDAGARERARVNYSLDILPAEDFFHIEERFDAITMWHVLEHVHALHEYLDKIRSLLKPKAKLFIAVPNYTSFDAKYYGEFWAAYDVPRHLYHFSTPAMLKLLTMHGLKPIGMKPMKEDSYYVSMLSEKYKSGKNNLPWALVNGLRSNVDAYKKTERTSSVLYIAEG